MKINIIDYFDYTSIDKPEKTAIVQGDRSITFRDLKLKTQNLAVRICSYGFKSNPIAVYLPKSIDCIIADIAVTYSGNIYMNLDIKVPYSRLTNIIKQINPSLIITDEHHAKEICNFATETSLIILEKLETIEIQDTTLLCSIQEGIIDTDPLCIINTSGSTGTPKGVVLNHRSYIDYLEWAIGSFNFTGEEVLGVLSPVVFDHYNYEICLMMAKGCTLVLLDNQMASFPVKLLESLRDQNVTYIFWVPTIMVNIANMDLLSKIELPSLKMIWFAGEVFPTRSFNYWRLHLPKATFVNLYGPVEASVDCTYYIVNRNLEDEEPIPIGHPCRNTDILILNSSNKTAEGEEEGELCIRGTSLAMGYYNNPEKTSESFVQNPLNNSYPEIIYRTGDIVFRNRYGEIVFKGRKDSLVKHLGYRVELGEIEHVIMNTLKLVDAGCVVYNKSKKEIVLFYESKEDQAVSGMRKAIANVLPKYMVPTIYIKTDSLPRNVNGKIDRLSLTNKVNNA